MLTEVLPHIRYLDHRAANLRSSHRVRNVKGKLIARYNNATSV